MAIDYCCYDSAHAIGIVYRAQSTDGQPHLAMASDHRTPPANGAPTFSYRLLHLSIKTLSSSSRYLDLRGGGGKEGKGEGDRQLGNGEREERGGNEYE